MTTALTRLATAMAALTLPVSSPVKAQIDDDAIVTARTQALDDRIALEFVRDLTTEVGPRMAGTEAEARARAWAIRRLTAMGFANVRSEPFTMRTWVRGGERAEVLSPFPQRLVLTALGNSGATPPAGLDGDVVAFPSLAAFDASTTDVRGKIVYIGHSMRRTQDGSSYGPFGQVRRIGPDHAAKRGAAAILIRSVGTDHSRGPHAGGTSFSAGTTPIPAAALSNFDADNLERMVARTATPIRVRLVLTPRVVGETQSGNVIAEVPGRDPAAGIVVAACHLDSWDLGTGALDDGAGCAIIASAAQRVAAMGTPRRTIRILFAGAEEVGGFGGIAYGRAHAADRHAVALESDFGADRIWRVQYKLPAGTQALQQRLTRTLEPLGIQSEVTSTGDGTDVEPLHAAGVAAVNLNQDGTRYFDLHHTPDDMFEMIDPAQLAQNVAAWTVTLAQLANAPEEIGSVQ